MRNESVKGIYFEKRDELDDLLKKIPFTLTKAQEKVMKEVLADQGKDVPMNRLVQGDVGSGKTIIAILSMFSVVKNNYQAVLMAPTEILATQHYEEIENI